MNPARSGFVFFFLLVYLPAQVYLLWLLKHAFREHVHGEQRRRLLLRVVGSFLAIMAMPLAGRALFGVFALQSYHWLTRDLFSLSTLWDFGSIGCATILIVYSVFPRMILIASKPAGAPPDLKRRDFLRKGVGLVASAPLVASGYGAPMERRRFVVDYLNVPVTGLSPALSQLTVVQLSDIHVGPFMTPAKLAEYVEAVNRLQPDLIALTGDFVTNSAIEVEPCVETLARLKSRYGTFACIGNHDIYARADDALTRQFSAKGIETLRNAAITLSVGDSKISVLGVDDLRWGHPDLSQALASIKEKAGEVKVLLSHRPEIFPSAAHAGIDLVLAGHYHAGQVKLGRNPASLSIARLLTPYADGLFGRSQAPEAGMKDRKSTLFVSRGIGITGLPIRINCPPQIAYLRLIR